MAGLELRLELRPVVLITDMVATLAGHIYRHPDSGTGSEDWIHAFGVSRS